MAGAAPFRRHPRIVVGRTGHRLGIVIVSTILVTIPRILVRERTGVWRAEPAGGWGFPPPPEGTETSPSAVVAREGPFGQAEVRRDTPPPRRGGASGQ